MRGQTADHCGEDESGGIEEKGPAGTEAGYLYIWTKPNATIITIKMIKIIRPRKLRATQVFLSDVDGFWYNQKPMGTGQIRNGSDGSICRKEYVKVQSTGPSNSLKFEEAGLVRVGSGCSQ